MQKVLTTKKKTEEIQPTLISKKEKTKNTTIHKKNIYFKKYREATNQWEADEK